jgi:acetolactate synthase-1/2/3 large subunit
MLENKKSPERLEDLAKPTYQITDLFIEYMEQLGVEYIFGIPGGAIEPLYNALYRSEARGGVKAVVARHETGAGFMCDGYYSNSGILGVCCTTTGPGATNLITAAASNYANQIPMLIITAQTPLNTHGRAAFQESSSSETGVDIMLMFDRITRFNRMITHVDQFERALTTAIRKAYRSPKGPVHLSIPKDVFEAPSPVEKPSFNLLSIIRETKMIDEAAFETFSDYMTSGYKIVFVVGDGAVNAIDDIIQVATLLNIKMVTTPHGKGLISSYHPLYRGVIGFAGHETAYDVVHDPSVRFIVAIGTRFGEWDSNGWDKGLLDENKLIHLSSDDGFFLRTPEAKLHLLGSIQTIFERLLDEIEDTTLQDFSERTLVSIDRAHSTVEMTNIGLRHHFKINDKFKCRDDSVPFKPQRLMKLLPQIFPKNTQFLADVGNSFAWAIHYMTLSPSKKSGEFYIYNGREKTTGRFRTCLDFSSMGWAQGAAIGTAFAKPGEPVCCITGDGAMLMSGAELTVALQHNLPVFFVVLNDSALGMVKHGQMGTGAGQIGTELPTVSYSRIARAMGIEAATIRSPKDLMELDMNELAKRRQPMLLDVIIDGNEIPPISLRTKMLKDGV